MTDYGSLEVLWFVLIGVLWTGYFLLEGFDFGVGMLLRPLGRDRNERRALMHAIGPVWDGNEVWLIVGGAAIFAAFPDWYATLFSGFYIPLLIIVFALLVRPVALEFWGKDDSARWRDGWELALSAGSMLAPFLWGVAFADIVRGVPVGAGKEFTGSLADLLNPYALLGGVTFMLFCAAHGATYLTLKTRGELLERARRAAFRLAVASALAVVAFMAWTLVGLGHTRALSIAAGCGAAVCVCLAPLLVRDRPIWAFVSGGGGIALMLATLFLHLFPNVLVSSTDSSFSLTLGNAASGSYTLKVMSVAAAVMLPAVLACQGWSYWVFRRRVGAEDFAPAADAVVVAERPREPV